MDGLQIEDAVRAPHNSMQQHLQQKLGKPTDLGQKTPLRGGLGLLVNESKTPGAKSLQGMTSARKTTSTIKKTIPYDDEYEVFQDDAEEEMAIKEIPVESCSSPVDAANRCETYDSLAADIADDMLNWNDRSVELYEEELPIPDDCTDPNIAEQEALATLGVEEWDEYPPIEIASRIAHDDCPLSLEEFRFEDVKLEEGDYAEELSEHEGFEVDREHLNELVKRMEEEVEDMTVEDLFAAEDGLLAFL